jgi:hypothetical protein
MVNVLVGDNAIGKTLVLKNKLACENTVSNFANDNITRFTTLDMEKVAWMSELLGTEYKIINNNDIAFGRMNAGGASREIPCEFRKLLILFCKSGTQLLLDEPDIHLDDDNVCDLAFLVGCCNDSIFREIWIVTHNIKMLNIEGCKYLTLNNDVLVEISKDEAYEYIDTI